MGPLSLDELKETLATVPDARNVLVWCEDFRDWKKAGDVPQLKKLRSKQRFRRPYSEAPNLHSKLSGPLSDQMPESGSFGGRYLDGHAAATPSPAMNSRRRICHPLKLTLDSLSRSGLHWNGSIPPVAVIAEATPVLLPSRM
jgi:GYF domain 2